MGGICTSKREFMKIQITKPIETSNSIKSNANKIKGEKLEKTINHSNNSIDENNPESVIILKNDIKPFIFRENEKNHKEKLKLYFFRKISVKRKEGLTKSTALDGTDSGCSTESKLVSNINEIIKHEDGYYLSKRLIFIILLKVTSVEFINYMAKNDKLIKKRKLTNPINMYKQIKSSSIVIKFNKAKTLTSSSILKLNANQNRFSKQVFCLEEAPKINLLPVLDDIELIYCKEIELQTKLQIIKCLDDTPIYGLFSANYEYNNERILSVFSDHHSQNSHNSLINNNIVMIKIFKDKKIYNENLAFLNKNYYKTILRPDEIVITEQNQYLIYKNKVFISLFDTEVTTDKLINIGRDLLLTTEYFHNFLKLSNLKLQGRLVICYNSHTQTKEEEVYLHEFSNLNNSTNDISLYKKLCLEDLYSVGSILYQLAYGYLPDKTK